MLLLQGPGKDASVYKEKLTNTQKPFAFEITVDKDIDLKNLYVKIIIRRPEGYVCLLHDLRANESERLKDIPIREKDDMYYKYSKKVKEKMHLGKISEAVECLDKVKFFASKGNQFLIPTLDVADYLSKYRSKRKHVVRVLTDVEDEVCEANFVVQLRYWRLRRDAVMRLAGYNDFRRIPLIQFSEVVAYEKGSVEQAAWVGFTKSFAQSYRKCGDLWEEMIIDKITKDEFDTLMIHSPDQQEILTQLQTLDPLLGQVIR